MTITSRGRKFTYNIINTQLMGKRIGESTADDSHGWIFADVVYNWWRHEIPRYTGITVFLRRYIIVGHFLIPRIPSHSARLCLPLPSPVPNLHRWSPKEKLELRRMRYTYFTFAFISGRELAFTLATCHRDSVCLLSVCRLWRWCTLLRRSNFLAIFFTIR